MRRLLLAWFPTLAYMAAIVVMSNRPPILESTAGSWFFPGMDKLAHAAEYGLLVLFLRRSLRLSGSSRPGRDALVATALFGVSDELHQGLLPYRSCELGDWLADVAGAAGTLWVWGKLREREEGIRRIVAGGDDPVCEASRGQ